MGYIRHHSIIVTSYNFELLDLAHEKANEIGCCTTDMTGNGINGYVSFCVVPDGSKEGWPDSEMGAERRNKFKEWLRKQRFNDGSSPYDWVEVQYGDEDELETKVIEDSDEPLRNN